MSAPFVPAWWCRGPHAQTLWAYFVRHRLRVRYRRERLELPDGDFLDLDWTENATGPIVIVLHGLEGDSGSPYARRIMRAVCARGWRGVVMHFRGCSGHPNRLPRSYHSGETGDLNHLVRLLRAREPDTALAAIGYSLGGNVLLKWLGETGAGAPLRAAAAVSVPFLLGEAARRMGTGFSRVYQWQLLGSLRRSVRRKSRSLALPIDLAGLRRLRDFPSFDDRVTAPLHGFLDADDYYRRSSSRQFLPRIAIPTLILHARDDPFMTPACVPHPHELSPDVHLEVSDHGGHVGFVSGRWPWQPRYWLQERIPEFLAAQVDAPPLAAATRDAGTAACLR